MDEAEFYCRATAHNAWDRDTLEIQIRNGYYSTIGNSSNNFEQTLPAKQSQLANLIVKDPYNFDFAGVENDALEKATEAIPEDFKPKLPSVEELESKLNQLENKNEIPE
jgi:predicted nuclease of restriction endonuclease-like (RecB) superfamily